VVSRLRWLLLDHEGRVLLAVVYSVLSLASVITYAIMRSPWYALGQLLLTTFGLFWVRWCIRRPVPEYR
jgi:hypothetical protein